MMTWTPSPADEVPNPAGINSLRKLFGFNLSKSLNSSKGEPRRPEPQQRQEEAQEQQDPAGRANEVELDELELSAEAPAPSAASVAASVASAAAEAAAGEAEAAAALPKSSEEPADEQTPDQKSVAQASIAWMDTVTMGTDDTPRKTADLYAADGVLWGTEVCAPDDQQWGTVSEEVRDTPEQIYAYYDYFARLPKLRLVEYTPAPVRVRGDFAAQAGSHMFAWQGADGTTVEMRARFSFTFRRDHPEKPNNPWMIVEHYSSSMPTVPAELKPNNTPQASDVLSEERAVRAKQVAELQQRAESAESLAAERAVLRVAEHAARMRHNAELEERARLAESLAAERAAQIAELQRRVEGARALAAEQQAQHKAELERRAAEQQARHNAELQRRTAEIELQRRRVAEAEAEAAAAMAAAAAAAEAAKTAAAAAAANESVGAAAQERAQKIDGDDESSDDGIWREGEDIII